MLKQMEFENPTLRPTGSAGNMQPMVDNMTPSDSMPPLSAPNHTSAANNHGFSPKGNGVGGAMGTHMGHDSAVMRRDDLTTSGDDKMGYGAA